MAHGLARLMLCLVLAAAPAAAASPAAAQVTGREWSATPLVPGPGVWDLALSSSTPGRSIAVYYIPGPDGPGLRARIGPIPGPAVTQELDTAQSYYPALDGSPLGGAVVAWYRQDAGEIRIAELPPGASEFEAAQGTPGSGSDYSYGRPVVRVNDRGDALVVYLAQAGDYRREHLLARYRPAGGEFGPPETVAGPAPRDQIFHRDAALGPDGTAVIGFVDSRRAMVSTRPPNGTFGSPKELPQAEDLPEHSWETPRVGIDSAGNVVAAWLEGAPLNRTGPVKLAFRQPGAGFGPAVDTQLRATDLGRIGLGVSLAGEVVLMVEASTDLEGPGTHIEGIHALTGNSLIRAIGSPRAISGIWGSYPSFSMNSIGDAVVLYEECCPMALRGIRRAPLGAFGETVDVQPPIEFEGSRQGRWVLDADMDAFGNAFGAWVDSEPAPDENHLGADGPTIEAEPPAVGELGEFIAPVLDDPPQPPGPPSPGSEPPPLPPQLGPPPFSGPPMFAGRDGGDRRPPRVHLELRRALYERRRPRVTAFVRCSESCALRLTGMTGGTALGPLQVTLRAGRGVELTLRVARRAARRATGVARRRGVRHAVKLSAVAVDAAGNVGTAGLP